MQSFGTGGSPSTSVLAIGVQKIWLTTEWKKYIVTVDVPSVTGKVLGTDNNSWLAVVFWFDAGSNLNTRAANLGQQSGTFDIAQVKLELGDVATPFVAPDPQQELARVQRYYETGSYGFFVGAGTNGGTIGGDVRFRVVKRAIPTVTLRDSVTWGTAVASTTQNNGTSIDRMQLLRTTTAAAQVQWAEVFIADARL